MKKCTNCNSEFPHNYKGSCNFCHSPNEHLSTGWKFGQTVYVNGKTEGIIIGTANVLKNGLFRNLYVVETLVDFVNPKGGLVNQILVDEDNLKEEYYDE